MMSENPKKRAPNFSVKEKTALLNIISNFKTVIENKKTDAVTWRQKDEAWDKVTSVFNSQSPENHPRTKESLRKLYDNIKKNVRKEVADEKKSIVRTGGGRSDYNPKDTTTELVLGLINQKTVYGLDNPFDSDNNIMDELGTRDKSITIAEAEQSNETSLNYEIIETDGCIQEHSYSQITHEKEYELQADISVTQTIPTINILTESGKPKLNPRKLPKTPAHKTPQKTDWGDFSANKLGQPITDEIKHKWTKRRRPNIQLLSSSQLAEEYLKLARIKNELYEVEKENMNRRNQREAEIFDLQKQKLLLDIEIKKSEIENLKLARNFSN